MHNIKIGLIREGKVPFDKRVALTPQQCAFLQNKYQGLSIFCQPSSFRSFSDTEYLQLKVPVREDLRECDILFGIKEVPVDHLIPDKTYLFFSHTLKKQPYNRKLLQEVLKKNITLIDYEAITNEKGERLVAFGKYAGVVGTYNAFRTIGLRSSSFTLPPAHTLFDRQEMLQKLKAVKLPNIKIVVTGSGRVAKGAKEILDELQIKELSPAEFLSHSADEIVYTMPRSSDYYVCEGSFSSEDFYCSPQNYKSTFLRFAEKADLLIAAAYWNPAAPPLFTKEDMKSSTFKIRSIADITCDINGSIPSTMRSSTIYDPFYDYNPVTGQLEPPFSSSSNISVMAIDNLPTELPRDASEFFGWQIIEHVFPALMEKKNSRILTDSIIAKGGRLTEKFSYLEDYVKGKS